jgi:hypothetical protein
MKKIFYFTLALVFSLSATTLSAKSEKDAAEDKALPEEMENYLTDEQVELLTTRVEEIRDMDKSDLSAEEKRELRHELKDIKKELQRGGGYVYLSVGTLIVILLILLLVL